MLYLDCFFLPPSIILIMAIILSLVNVLLVNISLTKLYFNVVISCLSILTIETVSSGSVI